MPFSQPDTVRYYTFEMFDELPVTQAMFTRQGGVSPVPWDSLNTGATVGDNPLRVGENRRRAFTAVNRNLDSMYDAWQVHSATVVCAKSPRGDAPHHKADAIITNNPDVTLFMRFADCVPILLCDPNRDVVGIVHAGWLGTVRFVLQAAVEAMHAEFGSIPGDIYAGIGPSIGVHHYQVGEDVITRVEGAFGEDAPSLLQYVGGKVQFNLWESNRLILERCGVKNIEVAEICTACHLEDWYSHRGEQGQTGRFGGLICLK
ncbi:MAG: peptidoglycan editing factor PgeF [Chloroflexi bacterium]|nr:MAG: peptidoglycan editing factor PgeF [Chloroflexota bacterium]